jgi:hypothetical protein
MMNADNVILVSAIATLGSTTAASILPHEVKRSAYVPPKGKKLPRGKDSDTICVEGEFPSFRMLFGTALVFTGLSMVGQFGPKFAAMFSLLIAFTAMTYYGFPLLSQAFSSKGLCKP